MIDCEDFVLYVLWGKSRRNTLLLKRRKKEYYHYHAEGKGSLGVGMKPENRTNEHDAGDNITSG